MSDRRLAVVTGTHRFPEPLLALAEPVVLDGTSGPVAAHRSGDLLLVNRRGAGVVPSHRIDHRANVEAIATECDHVLAIGSCRGLRPELAPGTIVAVDDVFAPWATPNRFEDEGTGSTPGFDLDWRAQVVAAWRSAAATPLRDGGTYVQLPGPRSETPAEARFYATVGDVVGTTLADEIVPAREVGLCHAAICVVDTLASGIVQRELTPAESEATQRANRERLWAAVFATLAHLGHTLG